MTFYGWDGSDFDLGRGPVDVEAMVLDLGNPCFVTHKATEGTGVKHGNYGNVIRRARAARATFTGAYVVPRTPGNNGHGTIPQQVDYLLAYLDEQTPGWRTWGDFFLQVDLEHWSANGTVYDAVTPVHGVTMADLIQQRTGKRAVLYAPAWAYGDTIGGTHALWASNYGSNPAVHFRAAYPGDQSPRWAGYSGRTPAILQYGSLLTIGGQPGCDANAYRGSVADFHQMIGNQGDDMLRDETIGGTASPGMGDRNAAILLADIWNVLMKGQTQGGGLWGNSPFVPLLDAATADEARDKASLAAIQALADVIKAGGGSVDVAAIGARIDAAVAQVRADITARFGKLAAAAKAQADTLAS